MKTGNFAVALALMAGAISLPALASAEEWPDKPIKIIVPFQAGSATDLITRQVGQALGIEYGQGVVIENKPGAAASIGSTQAAKSPADGYTLLLSGPASLVTNRFLYKQLTYDPTSFEKVSVVAVTPNILVANPNLPFKTLPGMIAYAKAHPGKLTYASYGTGTTSHMSGELLKTMAGIDIVHVPYKGSAEALPAVISGQVSMYFDTIMTSLPYIKDNKLNALAISTAKRSEIAPDVPTVAEQGYPGYDVQPWYGIVAPGGTPKPVIDKLSASIGRILQNPEFRAKLMVTGAEPSSDASPAAFNTMVDAEIPRTEKLVKQAGVTMQ
jgi:tripartite-type tricarboxylate transporter receptor subunit TctC